MTPRPFILDCDTGRDDALAIWIAQSLGLQLRAVISSYGNTVLDNVIENNRRVTTLGANHLPDAQPVRLFTGCDKPGADHTGYRNVVLPRQQVSGNGLCNLELPPAAPAHGDESFSAFRDFLAAGEEWDYVITGPATNCARLLTTNPDIAHKIRSITMMGGKLEGLWQKIPGPDFNIVCDPAAVKTLMHSGIPMHFVPMDATWPIMLTLEEIEKLRPVTPIAQTAKDLMIAHCRHFAPEPVFRFHDPAVIMACLDPAPFVKTRMVIVTDETHSDYARLVPADQGIEVEIFSPSDEYRQNCLHRMLECLGFKN